MQSPYVATTDISSSLLIATVVLRSSEGTSSSSSIHGCTLSSSGGPLRRREARDTPTSSSSLLLAAKTCQRFLPGRISIAFHFFFSNWCHTSYLSVRARINIVFHFSPLVVWCLRCLFEVFLTRSIWLCQSKVTLNPRANVVTSSFFLPPHLYAQRRIQD